MTRAVARILLVLMVVSAMPVDLLFDGESHTVAASKAGAGMRRGAPDAPGGIPEDPCPDDCPCVCCSVRVRGVPEALQTQPPYDMVGFVEGTGTQDPSLTVARPIDHPPCLL